MNKKVAVIGATGFVGKQVVKELANRGYTVDAIARDSSKIEKGEHVNPIDADVNNVEQLAKVLRGNDAVISTFNAGWTNPNLYNDFLTGSKNIERAVEESGVKRFLTNLFCSSSSTNATATSSTERMLLPSASKTGLSRPVLYFPVLVPAL